MKVDQQPKFYNVGCIGPNLLADDVFPQEVPIEEDAKGYTYIRRRGGILMTDRECIEDVTSEVNSVIQLYHFQDRYCRNQNHTNQQQMLDWQEVNQPLGTFSARHTNMLFKPEIGNNHYQNPRQVESNDNHKYPGVQRQMPEIPDHYHTVMEEEMDTSTGKTGLQQEMNNLEPVASQQWMIVEKASIHHQERPLWNETEEQQYPRFTSHDEERFNHNNQPDQARTADRQDQNRQLHQQVPTLLELPKQIAFVQQEQPWEQHVATRHRTPASNHHQQPQFCRKSQPTIGKQQYEPYWVPTRKEAGHQNSNVRYLKLLPNALCHEFDQHTTCGQDQNTQQYLQQHNQTYPDPEQQCQLLQEHNQEHGHQLNNVHSPQQRGSECSTCGKQDGCQNFQLSQPHQACQMITSPQNHTLEEYEQRQEQAEQRQQERQFYQQQRLQQSQQIQQSQQNNHQFSLSTENTSNIQGTSLDTPVESVPSDVCHIPSGYDINNLMVYNKHAPVGKRFVCRGTNPNGSPCTYSFPNKLQLRTHIDQHTNIRRFVCHTCEKCFLRKEQLTRHIKEVHIGSRNHVCPVCRGAFPRAEHKEAHIKSRHGLDADWALKKVFKRQSRK